MEYRVVGCVAQLRKRPADVCSAQSSSLKLEISFSPPYVTSGTIMVVTIVVVVHGTLRLRR